MSLEPRKARQQSSTQATVAPAAPQTAPGKSTFTPERYERFDMDEEVDRDADRLNDVDLDADADADRTGIPETKTGSARFNGDKQLDEIAAGTRVVKQPERSLLVTKLQQALADLDYLKPADVDGSFGDTTRGALVKFQGDKGVPPTGEFDKATILKLHELFDTRKPYVDKAPHDPANPGTRKLSVSDRRAAIKAMVAQKDERGFLEEVNGQKYADRIRTQLDTKIKELHKKNYADKAPLRADPAKNFHSWAALEAPSHAAKKVVDDVYASNYGGAAAFPALTHAGGNLIDAWEDQAAENAGYSADDKKVKAEHMVWYLIDAGCADINKEHQAVPSQPKERKILKPIVASFISDATKVQTLLEVEMGWPGMQNDGKVYLQRYKSTEADPDKAKDENRLQMWKIFHTMIHEYVHVLAHDDYRAWAGRFYDAGDKTRYHTLMEGMCDFFTLNARSVVNPTTVQAQVEGAYANGKPPPAATDVKVGVYASHKQAERVVSIVGVENAQAAYFRGQVKLMGKA